jgi:imidazolonepropionase-like amidohydrolase
MHGVPFPGDASIPELLKAFLRNGTWVDPTLTAMWARAHVHELAAAHDSRLKWIAPSFKSFWDEQERQFGPDMNIALKVLHWRMEGVKTLHDAGVPMLAGTDLGFAYVFPGDLANELEHFVEAGLSPVEALCGRRRSIRRGI